MSMYRILTFGLGYASIAATLTHVGFFYGREIYERFHASCNIKEDIHIILMKRYKDIPTWWFCISFGLTAGITFLLSFMEDQIQTPWWVLLLARLMAFTFTLPISIITATANVTPRLNLVTEYIMGLILPGKPIANACFKSYGHISMWQAVSFLGHFKLGHYMKIPLRSMVLVQFIGTIIAGTVNTLVAWWLLDSIHNICEDDLLPADSPWTCPGDRKSFNASVVWGLVGPKRVFGDLGIYKAMNWFFVGVAVGPIIVWLFHKAFPTQSWIPLVNLPVLLGVTSYMPSETVTCNAWIVVGTIFNFFVFHYRKRWWQRYNYILSAALDTGVAIMNVVLYIVLHVETKGLTWWGTDDEHCDLALCPTAKGIVVDGCPIY